MHALHPPVAALIREVARTIVLPHFQALTADQIIEKGPGDLVTVADRMSELRLEEGLKAILPGSRVVGEEACAADPSVVDGIDEGIVWIVDPIDGTGNYAAGRSPFAIMVALAEAGEIVAGWIYDPVADRMLHGALRGGAFVNDEPVHARTSGQDIPIAALAPRYLPKELRKEVADRTSGRVTMAEIPRCAGEQYPRVVSGQNDFALFWRSHPWDHAPGSVFLSEAGGKIARFDGSPYRIGDGRSGLIIAGSAEMWDRAAALINA